MLPLSLLLALQKVSTASGKFTAHDSPFISLWDDGASSWVDAIRDIAPQTPIFNWPNVTTIKRRISSWDDAQHPLWDGGISEWIDAATGYAGTPTPERWINGPTIARRGSKWDEPPQSAWDNGSSRWFDCAPGWDTPPGDTRRTWVIGKAGKFGGNVLSASGVLHTARLWIKPPDPATARHLARRAHMRDAVALWHADKTSCANIAQANKPGTYWSPFHRWIAHYLTTH